VSLHRSFGSCQKKNDNSKKGNLKSLLVVQGRKGGTGVCRFHLTVRLLQVLEFTRQKREFLHRIKTGYLTCYLSAHPYSRKGVFRIEWIFMIPVHDLQE